MNGYRKALLDHGIDPNADEQTTRPAVTADTQEMREMIDQPPISLEIELEDIIFSCRKVIEAIDHLPLPALTPQLARLRDTLKSSLDEFEHSREDEP